MQPADDDVALVFLRLLGNQGEGRLSVVVVGIQAELGHQDHVAAAAARFIEDLGELGVRPGVRTVLETDRGDAHPDSAARPLDRGRRRLWIDKVVEQPAVLKESQMIDVLAAGGIDGGHGGAAWYPVSATTTPERLTTKARPSGSPV